MGADLARLNFYIVYTEPPILGQVGHFNKVRVFDKKSWWLSCAPAGEGASTGGRETRRAKAGNQPLVSRPGGNGSPSPRAHKDGGKDELPAYTSSNDEASFTAGTPFVSPQLPPAFVRLPRPRP